jgi:type IV pilus assembly protein PilM
MLNTKSFLAVDFGAGSLKLAEFVINESGGLRLVQYGLRPLGAEGAQEATREAAILKALQDTLAEKGVKAKGVNVCAPGFHVFSKFVKLPPVDSSKVTQIIQYEAQQNVPFPLEEVVWDYQILGSTPGGELEVLLVAIKADIVEGLFRVTESTGLRLNLTDVSPAALCNSFRYNYGDLEDCTMLLDIGAKTSNLLFFEKGKVFSRSINLGANSITQDFANESKLKFDKAEQIKIEEGFVSLGGAYEEPENPHQAAISKIARQFMTRLHIQVNQTMQFYRGQQGGSAPVRLFLSGGASVMPYTAQFFAEKLNVPVEYFNPLRNVQLDPSLNLEELARVAHSLGEVVGLGLRNLAHCPVELNLMPESTLRWQSFNQKKPYFIASVFSLVAVVAAMALLFDKLATVKTEMLNQVKADVKPEQEKEAQFKKVFSQHKKTQAEVEQVVAWMQDRFYWADVLSELRQVLIRAEQDTKTKLHTDAGVWIEQFTSAAPRAEGEVSQGLEPNNPAPTVGAGEAAAQEAFRRRYGMEGRSSRPAPQAENTPAAPTATAPKKHKGETNELVTLTLTFRAVSLKNVTSQADADKGIAYTVLQELQSSPFIDPDPAETHTEGDVVNDEQTGTFTFSIVARLSRPLKL